MFKYEYEIRKKNKNDKFIKTLLETERSVLESLEHDGALWIDEGGWLDEGHLEEMQKYIKYLRKRRYEITDLLFQMRND